ncbi:MAG: SDR family NAD(P)-dependent oxidoreductase [Halioglobus sp.]
MKWILPIVFALSLPGVLAADQLQPMDIDHRIVLITGSTSGLGREVARTLADAGDHVIIHGRSSERGESLVKELNAQRPGAARFYQADFGSLADVRLLATEITKDYPRLDVLINNAGIALINDPVRRISQDGYELHFQVNYLSGFLLTDLLLPLLEKGKSARIINVASGSADPLDFDNLMLERDYSPWRAYGQSKLAQVMYTVDLSNKLRARKITVNSLHPATFMDTSMVLSLGVKPESSVMDGRDAVLHLVNDENVGNGEFYDGLKLSKTHAQAYNEAVRAQLWSVSEKLVNANQESR